MKKLFTVLLIALLLTACSKKPTVLEMQQQFEATLQQDGRDQLFSVENFQKTNGFQKSDNIYVADVKYDLVFKKDFGQVLEEMKEQARDNPVQVFSDGMSSMALRLQYGDFKAGLRISQEEKLTFIKTEQGWRIEQPEH